MSTLLRPGRRHRRGCGPPPEPARALERLVRLILPGLCALVASACGETTEFDADRQRTSAMSPVTRVCADGPTTLGIDVSHHQGVFDWQNAVDQGVRWAIVRISDGDFLDRQFERNWSELERLNVIRGAYQYFHPGFDVDLQARIVIDAVGRLGPGDLPVVLDHEVRHPNGHAAELAAMKRWITLVEQGTGKRPIIYTRGLFFQPLTATRAYREDEAYWGSFDYWIANYDATCPLTPTDPAPTWWAWQYTEYGSIPGHTGHLDLNDFNGTYEELQAYANANPFIGPPAPPPPSTLDCNGKADGWYVSDDTHDSVSLCCDSAVARTKACNQPHGAIKNFDRRHDFCLSDDGQGLFDCDGSPIPRHEVIPKDPAPTCDNPYFVPSTTSHREVPSCDYTCYPNHGGIDFAIADADCGTVAVHAPVACTVTEVVNDQPDRSGTLCQDTTDFCQVGEEGLGNHITCVEEDTTDTIVHKLGHMAPGSITVSVGERLEPGAFIGMQSDSGWTKTSSPPRACHVDHRVTVNGTNVNPYSCYIGLPADGLHGSTPSDPSPGPYPAPTPLTPTDQSVIDAQAPSVEFCWDHPLPAPPDRRLVVTPDLGLAEALSAGTLDPRDPGVCDDCLVNDTTTGTCLTIAPTRLDLHRGQPLYWVVRGGSANPPRGGEFSAFWSFTLEDDSLVNWPFCAAPSPTSPIDGALVDARSELIDFQWTPPPGCAPSSYDLVVTPNASDAAAIHSGTLDPYALLGCPECTTFTARLAPRHVARLEDVTSRSGPLYWLVRAVGQDEDDKGAWSAPTSLRVGRVADSCSGISCGACETCDRGVCLGDPGKKDRSCDGGQGSCDANGQCLPHTLSVKDAECGVTH